MESGGIFADEERIFVDRGNSSLSMPYKEREISTQQRGVSTRGESDIISKGQSVIDPFIYPKQDNIMSFATLQDIEQTFHIAKSKYPYRKGTQNMPLQERHELTKKSTEL